MDEQINRIRRAEDALDRAQSAVDGLEKAWDDYRAAADDIRLLGEYLNSEERRADIEADESGALPEACAAESSHRTRYGTSSNSTTN